MERTGDFFMPKFRKSIAVLAASATLTFLNSCQHYSYEEEKEQLRYDNIEDTKYTYVESEHVPKIPETLTLEHAKSLALANNPTLDVIKARMKAAKDRVEQAIANYYPTANLSGSYTHYLHTSYANDPSRSLDDKDSYTPNLGFDWLIYDGGGRDAQFESAKFAYYSEEEQIHDARRTLANAVASSYYSAQQASGQYLIALEDRKNNESFYDETKKKTEAGTAADVELYNFQVRINDTKVTAINAEISRKISMIALMELLGINEIVNFEKIKLPPIVDREYQLGDLTDLYKIALQNRPDIRSGRAEIKQAEAEVKLAQSEYMPQVSAFYNYGFTDIDEFELSKNDRDSTVGVEMNWLIFNGGLREYKIEEAKHNLEAQQENLEALWTSVVSEIRQQYESITLTQSLLEIQHESVKLNEMIYDTTLIKYKEGIENITRVNEVLTDLNIAKIRYDQV